MIFMKMIFIFFFTIASFSLTAQTVAPDSPVGKELIRRKFLKEWYRSKKPTQREYYLKVQEPVIEGNKKSYKYNLKYIDYYNDQLKKIKTEEAQKKYSALIKAYKAYAEANKKIVKSIMDGDSKGLEEGYATVRKCEAYILKVTGKEYPREWFLPEELRAAG